MFKKKIQKMTVKKFKQWFTIDKDVKAQIDFLHSKDIVKVSWINFFGFKVIDDVAFDKSSDKIIA